MKRVLCIFAHPDDEAFGPGGTIATLAKDHEVYILCATKGQKGEVSKKISGTLGQERAKELLASAKILGVKKVFFLGFTDGTLSNSLYHKLADMVMQYVTELQPEMLLTYEPHGVSGHIDHITMSMVTNFVFDRSPFVKKLMMHATLHEIASLRKDYFIYFPPGYKESEIDEIVDTSEVWDKKVKAMHSHKSQMHDVIRILKDYEKRPKKEYFLVRKQDPVLG
ncbi:MAG: PIG-L family deacetylase [Candidatus Levybacteria bacterium]|nr:PIG-L family deacetylase [Candidatus Levybacteria bacterium]